MADATQGGLAERRARKRLSYEQKRHSALDQCFRNPQTPNRPLSPAKISHVVAGRGAGRGGGVGPDPIEGITVREFR